jgi:hypothetical protein
LPVWVEPIRTASRILIPHFARHRRIYREPHDDRNSDRNDRDRDY